LKTGEKQKSFIAPRNLRRARVMFAFLNLPAMLTVSTGMSEFSSCTMATRFRNGDEAILRVVK
jgi:hypothetical protein